MLNISGLCERSAGHEKVSRGRQGSRSWGVGLGRLWEGAQRGTKGVVGTRL